MDRSQSFNAPPFSDGNNYAFWKVCMRAFLCAIDESVWDSIKIGWVRPDKPKAEWDKAAVALAMPIVKPLMLFFVVCLHTNFIGYLM